MDHRKKWLSVMAMTVFLTACGEAATTELTEPEAPPEKAAMTVEDVLHHSTEVMTDIQSFSTEMDMNQKMDLPDGESYTTDSSISMSMTQNPLALHQKMSMTLPEMGEMETEMYMVENGIYFKDGMEDTWFTYPEELTQDLSELQDMQMKPDEQLELLKRHTEHLSLEEDDSHYIVTVNGSSDILQGFARELNGLMNDELSGEMDQMMNMADIHELDYTLYIEKETFLQTEMDMKMTFELKMEGESIMILTTTNATFSHFNEIDEITVPSDVLESAEEFGLDFTDFEEMNDIDLQEAELPEDTDSTDNNEG